jgi:hypothetical protein
LLALEDS